MTREEAFRAKEFHKGKCVRGIGSRGGVTVVQEIWRRSGQTKTWKTRPEQFRIPVKYGLRNSSYIDQYDLEKMHTADTCPLLDPNYVTSDLRVKKEE